ncbi:MAG: hypothetical protein WCO02_11145 [Bacteroidota bacterium]
MNINKIPFYLNILLFLVTLYLNLNVQWDRHRWEGFADSKDYLKQSKVALFSKDFFIPRPDSGYYPRPFTIPMFYKAASSNAANIVTMQQIMHSIAAVALVYAMLLMLTTGISRYLVMLFIYFLMSWWNILGWTTLLLSESLSTTFVFLWIATFVMYFCKRTPWFLVLHALTAVLFSFTRDSWPYLLLLLYLCMILIAWLLDRKLLKGMAVMLLLSLAIYFLQGKSSEIGQRTRLPVMNNIILRVMPVPEHYAWFISRGMPEAVLLKKVFRHVDLNKEADLWKVYGLYVHPEYKKFSDWAATDGKGLYMKFLLTHPRYTLMLDEPEDNLKRIFAYNLEYPLKASGYSSLADEIFPVFPPFALLFLSLLLGWVFIRKPSSQLLLPIVFGLVFLFNVYLIYNADTMEVSRHLFITLIMVQLISVWIVGVLIDELVKKMRSV